MKINKMPLAGGKSPLLFCLGMFFVALFFSVSVCSAIYYVMRTDGGASKELVKQPVDHNPAVFASIVK